MQDFGPRVPDSQSVSILLQSGLRLARLKLAYVSPKNRTQIIKRLQGQAKRLGKELKILVELKGPRLRVAKIDKNGLDLERDQNIIIASTFDLKDFNSSALPAQVIPINYPFLADNIKKGDKICLGHENKLAVIRVEDNFIYARVSRGGRVLSGDDLSVPYLKIQTDCITGQDLDDLEWANEQRIDFVVPPVVKSPKDIIFLKNIIKKIKPKSQIKVLVKINSLAVWAKRGELAKAADGLVLDSEALAQEMPKAKLNLIEREFINKNHATEKIHLMV